MITQKFLPFSYIFDKVKVPFFIVLTGAVAFETLPLILGYRLPEIPINIATTLGIAISILLSFKIGQSYDRWWEARKIWGAIVNDSRSLVLQLQLYLEAENPVIRQMAYRQIAWCYALTRSLREQEPMVDLDGLLPADELDGLRRHKNVPLGILGLQTASAKQLSGSELLDNFSRLQIDETLVRLTASMGKCERIKNTVFPTNYRKGLHLAIYLFSIFLILSVPLQLSIVLEIVIVVVLSMIFFYLEKAAYLLQDPFENLPTDTAMTAISRTIDINLRQLLGETELPPKVQPEDFYLM
ncbi:putative membrane protein [Neolewinella xylanilytica]|uniref:Putative membrane protein n=1 Tax=Neolewinella xylanilytica TaxID=1514080 RepID=A0A2S6IA24_9BACT|nr:bestrophin family ion channel [Neolewinella xylanilytica]PPK88353.1 putative membrane protein [Neolewinella xylanilytica]